MRPWSGKELLLLGQCHGLITNFYPEMYLNYNYSQVF